MESYITTIMQQKKQFHKAHCKHVTKQGKQIATYTNVINVMPAVFCFFNTQRNPARRRW